MDKGNLTLTFKQGERVTLLPDVEITVSEISRSRVKLAFTAPRDRRIVRNGAIHRDRPLQYRGYVIYSEANGYRWHFEGMTADPDDPRYGWSPSVLDAISRVDEMEAELERELRQQATYVTTEEAKRAGAPF